MRTAEIERGRWRWPGGRSARAAALRPLAPFRSCALLLALAAILAPLAGLQARSFDDAFEQAAEVAGKIVRPAASPAARAGSTLEAGARTPAYPALDTLTDQVAAELSHPARATSLEQQAALSHLRASLATIRERARARSATGTLATRVLQAQIASLGPVPGEGGSEPAAITERRAELDSDLSLQMQPVIDQTEAFARASALVGELDARIRELEQQRLTRYNGTPLNPVLWIDAAGEVARMSGAASDKVRAISARDDEAFAPLRIIELLGLAVLVPLALGWLARWMMRAFTRAQSRPRGPIQRLLLVLAQDVLLAIVLGVALLTVLIALALLIQPVTGEGNEGAYLGTIFTVAISVLVASWLGSSLFRSPFPQLRIIDLDDASGTAATRLIVGIGAVMGLASLLDTAEDEAAVGTKLATLLSALFLLVGGWLVWRLATILGDRATRRQFPAADAVANPVLETVVERGRSEKIDFAGPIARIMKAVVLASAAAAVVGFVFLSRWLFSSIILTSALVAIGVYLQRAIRLVLEVLAERRLRAYRGVIHFVPIFTGFALTLAALPLIAMIWGYSGQEILDGVVLLRSGVSFGDVTISAGDVITFALVFVVGWFVTRWVQRILRVSVLPQFALDLAAVTAIVTIVGYIGIVLAAVVAIATMGLDLSNLAVIAGALSVGLGFGLQGVIENFVSGIILLLERPVRVGDWIEVGEHSGIVRKISVRSTDVETWDRHHIIIPNSQLVTGTVKNLSLGDRVARVIVDIGVAYATDLDHARAVLIELALAHELVLEEPAPFVTVKGFGDSAVELQLFSFVEDVTKGAGLRSDLQFAIHKRFSAEGIEIPYPQRDLHVKGAVSMLTCEAAEGARGREDADAAPQLPKGARPDPG